MVIPNPPRQMIDDEMMIRDGKVWYRVFTCYYCGRKGDDLLCPGCGAPRDSRACNACIDTSDTNKV